jgi:hypothetical protein
MKTLLDKYHTIDIRANPHYDYLSSLTLYSFSKRFELIFGECQAIKSEYKGNFTLEDNNKLILEFETEKEGNYKKYYRKHYLNYQIVDERKEHDCGYGISVSYKTIIFDKSPFQFNDPRTKYDPNNDYYPSIFYFNLIDKRYEKKEEIIELTEQTMHEYEKNIDINDSEHNNLVEVVNKDENKKPTYADIVRKKKE